MDLAECRFLLSLCPGSVAWQLVLLSGYLVNWGLVVTDSFIVGWTREGHSSPLKFMLRETEI